MKNLSRLFIAFFCVMFCMSPLHAQWIQTNQMNCANVTCFAVSGSNIFAGTSLGGVFRSSDNGTTWTEADSALTNLGLTSLAAIGTNIFAGTKNGVYMSTDYGKSWTPVNNGLYYNSIIRLLVFDSTLYAVSGKVSQSTNNGASWTISNFPDSISFKYPYLTSIVGSGDTRFALFGKATYRSTDNGNTWKDADILMPSDECAAIALINGTYVAITQGYVCRSTDNGATWIADLGKRRGFSAFAVMGKRLFALASSSYGSDARGIYVSADEGATWSNATGNLPDININAMQVVDSTLFVGTAYSGIFKSTDYGASWTPANNGLSSVSLSDLVVKGTTLFASTYNFGIFRSTDYGNTWIPTNAGLQPYGVMPSISALAVSGSVLIAAQSIADQFRSTDNGDSWSESNNVIAGKVVSGLKSAEYIPFPYRRSFAVSDSCIYAGGGDLLLSKDEGKSWRSIGGSLRKIIFSLAIVGEKLIAGTDAGLYSTTDNGISWVKADLGMGEGYDSYVTTLAVSGTHVFAGTFAGGVFRSGDKGQSWSQCNLKGLNVFALAVYGSKILAGTDNDGVFASTDEGEFWSAVNTGLKSKNIRAFAVNGTDLYVATSPAGVWRRPLSEIVTSIDNRIEELPRGFSLEQNYPNPFNPMTTVSFSLPSNSFVSLKIFDVMGREVATLVSEKMPEGKYSRVWNASGMPSGVYFYRLQAGAYTETKRLILLK